MMVYFVNAVLLWSLCVAQLSEILQPVPFQTVKLGDSATIECHIKSEMNKTVWYKLTTENRLQLVVAIDSQYNQSVFADKFGQNCSVKFDRISSHLSISATTRGVAGTYFCGIMHLNDSIQFGSGTFLMVEGENMKSDSVIQQPKSQSVKPGDVVTLSCSVRISHCAAELTSIKWLKSSFSFECEDDYCFYDYPAKTIYSSGNQNHICKTTESGETICLFYLLMTDLSSDDAGTYFCVVTSCGHMMTGGGTFLDSGNRYHYSFLCHIPGPEIAAITLLGVPLIFFVWMIIKRKFFHYTESNAGFSAPSTTRAEGYQAEENPVQHAALMEKKMDGSRRRRDNTWSECVYLSAKQ